MHPWNLLKEVAFLSFVLVLGSLYMCKITTLTGMIRARMMGYQWVLPDEHDVHQAESDTARTGAYSLAVPFFTECSLCAYLRSWFYNSSSDP